MKEIKRSTKIQLLKSGACILVALVLIINTVFLYASSDGEESADPSPSVTETETSTDTAKGEESQDTADTSIIGDAPEANLPEVNPSSGDNADTTPEELTTPESIGAEASEEPSADAAETPTPADEDADVAEETPSVEPSVSPSVSPSATPTPTEEPKEEAVKKLSVEEGLPAGISGVSIKLSKGVPETYSLHVGYNSGSDFSGYIASMKEFGYDVRGSKAFDIHIEENGDTVDLPAGAVAEVTVDFSTPLFTGKVDDSTLYTVLHMSSDIERLDVEEWNADAGLTSVTFTTSSFSPFDVVAIGDIDDSNGGLQTLETGDKTTDLSDLLTKVSITTADGKAIPVVDEKLQVNAGEGYKVTLEFQEKENGVQFDAENSMTYKLPAGMISVNESGEFTIPIEDTAENKIYDVPAIYNFAPDGTVTIIVCPEDKDCIEFRKFMASGNVCMELMLEVKFAEDAKLVSFGKDGIKDVVVNDEHKVTVTKEATSYDADKNIVNYTIKVTSKGTNTNVKVSDTFDKGILTYNKDLTYAGHEWYESDEAKAELAGRIDYTNNDDGFDLTISSMKDGETVYLKYSASANAEAVADGKMTADNTRNAVKVESKEDPDGDSDECTVENIIKFGKVIEKASSEVADKTEEGEVVTGTKTVTWTIDVNKNNQLPIDGWVIKDKIAEDSQKIMKYSGTGITITIVDENGDESSKTVNWEELGIDPESDTGWSYKVPDGTGKASYKITYTTDVDVSEQVKDITVNNNAEVEGKDKDGGSATVTPGKGNNAGVTKEVISKNDKTVKWKVTATIPAIGLDDCKIVDNIPASWGDLYDIIDDKTLKNIKIEGLLEEESYDVELNYKERPDWDTSENETVTGFTVTFYKNSDKTIMGLNPSKEERTITLEFETTNNEEWVQNSDALGSTHTNNVDLYANNVKFSASASVDLQKKGENSIAKVGYYKNICDGYPAWEYTLTLSNVTSDTVEIFDTFDTEILRYADKLSFSTDAILPDHVVYYSNSEWGYQGGEVDSAIVTGTDDGMKITISGLPKDSGAFYKNYQIKYWLIVKDDEALNKLNEETIKNGGKTSLTNKVSWEGAKDSVTLEYENNVLKKDIIGHPEPSTDSTKSYVAKYAITFNEQGLRLNDGNPIAITDTMSANLRFKPETLKVYGFVKKSNENGEWEEQEELQEEIDYTWDLNGSVLTLNVPDEKKIRIEYGARVLGAEDTTQIYTNKVEALGNTSEKEGKVVITSAGLGKGSIPSLKIYKYAYGSYKKPLAGAKFELQEQLENGEWTTVQGHGKDVIATTDSDGMASLIPDKDIDGWTFARGVKYRLKEIAAPDGYTPDAEEIYFTFSEAATNNEELFYGDKIDISNGKENFRIVKKSRDNNILSGAVFTLAKDAKFTEVVKTVTTGDDGIASFSKLEPGTYYLKETVAPAGYRLDENTYEIEIDEDLHVTCRTEGLSFTSDGAGNYSADIYDDIETGSIIIKKTVTGTDPDAVRYTFDVINTETSVNYGPVTVSANGEGTTISDLPLGTYEIKETGDLEREGYKWTVSITGATQSADDKTTATLVIDADKQEKTVTYTNNYTKLKDTGIILEGTKVLSGGDLANRQFEFVLSGDEAEGVVSLPDTKIVPNIDGKFTFGEIKFSKAGTYTFTVKEVRINEEGKKPISGIDYDAVEYTVTVVVSEDKNNGTYKIDSVTVDSTVAAKSGEKTYTLPTHTREGIDGTATFVNRVEKGNLKITKAVVVKDVNGNEVTDEKKWPDDLKNKIYTFTLTDSNKNVYKEDGTIDPDGKAVITLTADESKKISNLPVDVTYTLAENDASIADYQWDVNTSGVDITNISITDRNDSLVTFTNEYTKVGDINVQLKGTKALKDGTLVGNDFTFVLSGEADGMKLPESLEEVNDSNGTFTFNPIVFEKKGTYQVTISEKTPDTDDNSYVYDRDSYTVDIEVKQNGNKYEIISVKVGNTDLTKVAEGIYALPTKIVEGKTASFINREKKGDLTINKTVSAPIGSGFGTIAYQFTVMGDNGKYYDADGNAYDTAQTIAITPGKDVTITGLPVGDYTVTEIAPNYDKAVYNWKVTGNGSVNVTDQGAAIAAFTNTFTEIGYADMSLKGTKALAGGDLAGSDYVFKFDLTLTGGESNNVEMPTQAQVQNADGSFTFNDITFKGAGSYTFTVKENVAGKISGIDYDEETTYLVTVEVGLNDAGTAYEVKSVSGATGSNGTYTLPNKDGETASFVNRVEKGSLKITKTVTVDRGAKPEGFTSGPYTFTVQDDKNNYYNENGEIAQIGYNVTIEAGGEQIFNNLPIGTYTVSETNANVEKDGYKWTVTVNAGDGQVGTVKVEDGKTAEVAFINNYTEITGTSIVLKGTKLLTGDTTGNDYWFHIEQKDSDPVQVEGLNDVQNSGNDFRFGDIEFTEAGTYNFTVSEVEGSNNGIEYSGETYDVTVVVGKNTDGTAYVVEEVTGAAQVGTSNVYDLPKKLGDATFVNRVKTGELTIKKAEGAAPFGNEDFTFTVQDKNNKTYDKDGKQVAGATITLKPSDSVTLKDLPIGDYTVSEADGNQEGYVWKVKVSGDVKEQTAKGIVKVEVKDKLTENTTVEVTFTNEYEKIQGTSITLKGTKDLEDGDLAAGDYSFKIVQNPVEGEPTVEVPEDAVNDAEGNFRFDAINLQKDGTYHFTVSEVRPEGEDAAKSGIEYDTTEYPITVKVEAVGAEYKVTKVEGAVNESGNTYVIEKKENKAATFVNRVKKGSLAITKKVTGDADADGKTYYFIVKDTNKNIYDETGKVDQDAVIAVKAGATVTVKNLPVGDYTVIERDSDVKISGYTWSVKVNGEDGKEAKVTVSDGGTGSVEFENYYEEMNGISITLKGTKALIGRDLAGGEYSFAIKVTSGNAADVDVKKATTVNEQSGEIDFGVIEFNKAGTYTFEVSETSTSSEVACDGTTYEVEVKVNEVGDTYEIEYVMINGNEVDPKPDNQTIYELPKQNKTKGGVTYEASFINELKQNSLFIKKNNVVNNTGNTDFDTDTYYFTVAKVKTIDGTAIDPIYYNQSGAVVTDDEAKKIAVTPGETVEVKNLPEGFYVVKEEKSGYDDSAYKWDVEVTNATKNEAEAGISVSLGTPPATAEFTNTFTKITPVSMDLKGTKTLDGGEISKYNGQFEFILTQGEASEGTSWVNVSMPTTSTTNIVDGGKGFTFENITFNKAGTYTFIVREYGAPEAEKEDRIPGIDYDEKEYEVVVTVGKNDAGTAYEVKSVFVDGTDVTRSGDDRVFDLPKQDGKTASFVNRVMKGSLKITKAVTATPASAELQAGPYIFTVQDENGKTYNAKGEQEEGVTISVTPENPVIIDDLPVGEYTISEVGDRTGYVWNVIVNDENDAEIQQTEKGIVEVEISDNGTADVTFNNTYTEITGTYITLEGTKYLDGGTQTAGDYKFEIVQVSEREEAISDPITVSTSTYDANGNFKLQIPFDKAGTYYFKISEVNTGKSGIAYDESTNYGITVKVDLVGDKYQITSVTGDVEGSGNSYKIKTPTGKKGDFVNRVMKGWLEITKTVKVGEATITPDKSYYFTVQSGNTYYAQDGTPSNVPVKIEVKAGATVPVNNLPVGEYTVKEVTEEASDVKIPGYKWLYVSGDEESVNMAEANVPDNGSDSVSFVNHYEEIGEVSVKLTGSKVLIGGSLGTYDFAIQATGDNAADVAPEKTTTTNGSNGQIDFGQITFSKAGTYTFEVKETSSSTAQIKCDGTTYTVEVKVEEDGDAYVVKSVEEVKKDTSGKEIRKGLTKVSDTPLTYELLKQKKTKGTEEYEASFINEVKQNNLIIEKIVDDQTKDGGFASDTYYFTVARVEGVGDYTYYDLKGQEGTKDTRISVQAGKSVEVKNLPEGVYIVSEVDPTYNTTKYSWEVDGNGRVKVEYGQNPATVTFTNTFTDNTPASMNIKGTKILKGGKIEDYSGKFKFTLTPVGENWGIDEPVEAWNENGEFTFSNMTFMGEGTYTFTVEEAGTGEDGIDYDTEKYTVTVNVIPDADGYKVNSVTASDKEGKNYTLTSEGEAWILPTHERNGETATFVNEKEPEKPVSTATPTATPTSTETPTPGATSTPGTTPSATETPGPSATPGTTPEATATPAVTPGQTPGPEETPTPEVVPTPDNTPNPVVTPGNNPAPTPRGSVLGARKVRMGGTQAAVLGARRGADFAVLGKRRRPSTGDSMALLIWIITMSVAMGGAITSSTMLSLENGRKRRRRR